MKVPIARIWKDPKVPMRGLEEKKVCVCFGFFLVELGILPLFTCTDRFGKGKRKQLSVTSKTFGNS